MAIRLSGSGSQAIRLRIRMRSRISLRMKICFEGIFTCKQEAVVPVARVAADSLWLGQH